MQESDGFLPVPPPPMPKRPFRLVMRGVFPPERAATQRPALEAMQAFVDANSDEIWRRGMERMRHDLLYGTPVPPGKPLGVLHSPPLRLP